MQVTTSWCFKGEMDSINLSGNEHISQIPDGKQDKGTSLMLHLTDTGGKGLTKWPQAPS